MELVFALIAILTGTAILIFPLVFPFVVFFQAKGPLSLRAIITFGVVQTIATAAMLKLVGFILWASGQ
jgi:hypothetical protein